MEKFEIYDISSVADDLEQLGTKEKFWFIDSGGNKWLFKYSRPNTGEHWSEKAAEQLCEILEIPHAEYQLASCKGRPGVITRNIVPVACSMVMGNEVLNSFDPDHYPEPQPEQASFVHIREHTIKRLAQCFGQMKVLPPMTMCNLQGLDAMAVFCGYLMLDVLISNQDRHHENWAILIDEQSGVRTLCPTYDHAASLGRELLDSDRIGRMQSKDKNRQIPAFVRRARSEFFGQETDIKPLMTIDAFFVAVAGRTSALEHWMAALKKLSPDVISSIFTRIPDEFISEDARRFAIQMILENKRRLLNDGRE